MNTLTETPIDPEGLDDLYRRNYGITRTGINEKFLQHIPRESRILEVGRNMGKSVAPFAAYVTAGQLSENSR